MLVRTARRVDVHQHLWPDEFVEQLRRRNRPPYLRVWTLHTTAEAPFHVRAADHDPAARAALDRDTDFIGLSLSTPLGIEDLDPDAAAPLLDAWHDGVRDLPAPFRPWASICRDEPDLSLLRKRLQREFVGLQVPATWLGDPAAVERLAPALVLCAEAGRPVLVHPGPAQPSAGTHAAPWWPAVVDYSAQLQRAWWAWHVAGRTAAPGLRICFVAGAGMAPLLHERFTARGGGRFVVDPDVFVDTSGCGARTVDALIRVLGVDAVVQGSDRPYATPADRAEPGSTARGFDPLGEAAWHAVNLTNPHRLFRGGLS